MKRAFKAGAGLPVLGALLWIPLALGVCALPVSPGCSEEESLPRDPEMFLILLLATEDTHGASFALDRAGRSQFLGGYTVWMLTPFRTCRTVPPEDVIRLQDAWRQAVENPGEKALQRPSHPFVALSFHNPTGVRQQLYVKPDRPGQDPTLEHAVALTARILQQVYGDRVLREFQAADLAELLAVPPNEEHLNSNS
ncbi:MAG TPA: hypothetical protein VLF66_10665 [Thermoanaerobaculia bacterium]|nr:hypothetical protein [Thermoanaerobaculia bacterium]